MSLSGDPKQELHGVVWRFKDDFNLVSYNKSIMPLCQFLRKLAIDNGLGDVSLDDHKLAARMLSDAWLWMSKGVLCVIL